MIELVNVTKSYATRQGRRYVFRDLNFRFPDGVSIGVMGRNGAGKSTLMNLIGGIDTPDRGEVRTDASLSWPVGLSSGFQRDLTGRENVEFVCRIHGVTHEAMRQRVAFVRDFADIGDYFELPMNTYSKGMRSRVAFGLSMAFDFDYYLIDEAMAVGDPQFKRKSRAVFAQRMARARMILVSHNAAEIRDYCDVVVLVDGGNAVLYQDLEAGIAAYENTDGSPLRGRRRDEDDDEPAALPREKRSAFFRRRRERTPPPP
jgi:capsular polysaccharide transport system ATP-binding protein